ncbi:MAG: nucleotide exchange factor GrpE [Oscillospiraceae bacterium]|nr:nucleotide exchange factor GrpE [Oscillospiraceae bacterium]
MNPLANTKKKKDTSPETQADEAMPETAAETVSETQTQESAEECPIESNPEAEWEARLKAEQDKYLRLAAEYDNFRKRSLKERDALRVDIRSAAVSELLPVYDNLERALSAPCSDEAFYKGVEMTMSQLKTIFEGMGVSQIPAVGETFNPNLHNAVMHVDDDTHGAQEIVQEFQKGFKLGDKVIRHSMVQVAN